MDLKVCRRMMWRSRLKWLKTEAWVEANFCRFDIRLNRDIARSRRPQRQVTVLSPIIEVATDLLAVDIPDFLHRRSVGSELVCHNSLRCAVSLHGFLQDFAAGPRSGGFDPGDQNQAQKALAGAEAADLSRVLVT